MKKFFLIILLSTFISGINAQTTLDTALNFNVKDIYGNSHKLFHILDSNNYVVLNFFTTSCGPCVTYAPEFQQAYLHYNNNTCGVYFLGIVWGSNNASVHDFDSTYGLTFPTVSGSQGNGNSVILAYNILSYPTVILIAPNHEIINQYIYPPSFQVIDSTISAAMGITSSNTVTVATVKTGVFPNPARDEININYRLGKSAELRFDVSSILGEKLISILPETYAKGQLQKKINISSLPSGIYFIKISSRGETLSTLKFVKR